MFLQIYRLCIEDIIQKIPSLWECNTDKARVYNLYQNDLIQKVYGSSCTFLDSKQKYQMMIFRSSELN